jgi:hypothetical protein
MVTLNFIVLQIIMFITLLSLITPSSSIIFILAMMDENLKKWNSKLSLKGKYYHSTPTVYLDDTNLLSKIPEKNKERLLEEIEFALEYCSKSLDGCSVLMFETNGKLHMICNLGAHSQRGAIVFSVISTYSVPIGSDETLTAIKFW